MGECELRAHIPYIIMCTTHTKCTGGNCEERESRRDWALGTMGITPRQRAFSSLPSTVLVVAGTAGAGGLGQLHSPTGQPERQLVMRVARVAPLNEDGWTVLQLERHVDRRSTLIVVCLRLDLELEHV